MKPPEQVPRSNLTELGRKQGLDEPSRRHSRLCPLPVTMAGCSDGTQANLDWLGGKGELSRDDEIFKHAISCSLDIRYRRVTEPQRARRTTSASENGSFAPPACCSTSWPLPAISTTSCTPASATARVMAR